MAALRKQQTLNAVQAMIGYEFQDRQILWEALHASGAPIFDAVDRHMVCGNQRLALVGDKFLSAALAYLWYPTGQALSDAQASISEHGSNRNLANVGREFGLGEYIIGNPAQWGRLGDKTVASTVEAILGAVWEDSHDMNEFISVMRAFGLA